MKVFSEKKEGRTWEGRSGGRNIQESWKLVNGLEEDDTLEVG